MSEKFWKITISNTNYNEMVKIKSKQTYFSLQRYNMLEELS